MGEGSAPAPACEIQMVHMHSLPLSPSPEAKAAVVHHGHLSGWAALTAGFYTPSKNHSQILKELSISFQN